VVATGDGQHVPGAAGLQLAAQAGIGGQRLARVVTTAVAGYQEGAEGPGRLWIESWHFGIRDAEMRADAVRDYGAWRGLVADVIRLGAGSGRFARGRAPSTSPVLTIALVDGVGIPFALGDPEITAEGAIQEVLSALEQLVHLQ
jgi:hypothetical protein